MTQTSRVLIIEDDPNTLELLGLILDQKEYEISLALGGREGIRLLEEQGADVILLDLMMDDMDGWTVLETIRAKDHLRSVPVIIVSARSPVQRPDETAHYADMFEGYLVKPFVVHDLLIQVEEALD